MSVTRALVPMRIRASSLALCLLGLSTVIWGCSDGATPATPDASPADASADAAICPQAVGLCDDHNACTSLDHCGAVGICSGTAIDCADDASCTTDACDPLTGCTHTPPANTCVIGGSCVAAGTIQDGKFCSRCVPATDAHGWSIVASQPCDDGDACTSGDVCGPQGACNGKALACDDANPCTLDSCKPGAGCVNLEGGTAPCEDGNPCTTEDACLDGKCKAGKGKLKCDDGDPCTADTCEVGKGCIAASDPKACDDGKPCTADSCDSKQGCAHTDLKVGDACQGADLCISGETCDAKLACTGGGIKDCDDKNLCTTDSCKSDKGCLHAVNKAPCNDGFDCSEPDVCTGGQCIGIKTKSCPLCQKFFSDTEGKLTIFQIGSSGVPGEGIDIDGDPKTCAPEGNCSGGIDNAASVLALFVNQPLIAAIGNGSMTFVAEFEGWQGEGVPFTLNLYYAVPTEAAQASGCDGQKQVCEWYISQSAMSAGCKPKFSFPNAKVVGGKLVAGGADTLFAMDADLIGGKNATLYVKGARIEGNVTLDKDGKTLVSCTGVLGGAVPHGAVLDIINSLDESVFAQVGQTKQTVLDLVEQALELDIDIDGDGQGDAASIGLRFSAMGAKVAGFQEKSP
jgi:hypothetical protein